MGVYSTRETVTYSDTGEWDAIPRLLTPLIDIFEDSNPVTLNSASQLMLYVTYVKGNSESMELLLEFSPNGSDWFRDDTIKVNEGTITEYPVTYSLSSDVPLRIPKPVCDRHFRIRVRGIGLDLTGAQCQVIAYYRR